MATSEAKNDCFRILSLDGGGIKGTYTASVLASLEAMTGKQLWQHFDLITGTSTGGIIAVGLGMGVSAARILQLYEERGAETFPMPKAGWRGNLAEAWRHCRRPKHSQEVLKNALDTVIGERKLGESKVRLVIPAFDAVRGSIQLFKTAHAEQYKQDYLLPALTVALGTSAAPTYYPAYVDAGGGCYLDGGVWANCPVQVGLLEASCILRQPIERVSILSIGTTSAPFDISRARRRGGLFSWNKGLIDLLMQAQGEAALGQVRLQIGERLLRVDSITRPDRFSLDNSRVIDDLKSLGTEAARLHEAEITRRFLTSPARPFTPCYVVSQQDDRREPKAA